MLLVSLLTVTSSVLADPTAGMMAGSFLRTGISGRSRAMGNATTAIATGYSVAFDNPAGLPRLKHRYTGITMHKLALDRSYSHLAFASPLKGDAGVSLSWVNAGVKDIDSRDLDGHQLQSIDYYDNAFALGFSISPKPDVVSIGLNVKILYGLLPRIKDDNSAIKATGVGFDVGALVTLPYHLQAGLVIKDLGSKYTWNTDGYWSQGSNKIDRFPKQIRAGLAYRYQDLTVASDFETMTGKQTLRLGSEYRFFPEDTYSAAFRAGVDGKSPTFGVGFEMPFAKWRSQMDYAYVLEAIAPEDTHVLTWQLIF